MLAATLSKGMAFLAVCGFILSSCTNEDDPVAPTDEVESQLQKMTLREKVGQLFYVRPECLDTTIHFNLPSGIDESADDIKAIKLQAVNATMLGVNAVVKAVENGTLSEQRIDQSVRRILRLKKTNRQIDETPSWNDQRPVLKGCEVRGKGC